MVSSRHETKVCLEGCIDPSSTFTFRSVRTVSYNISTPIHTSMDPSSSPHSLLSSILYIRRAKENNRLARNTPDAVVLGFIQEKSGRKKRRRGKRGVKRKREPTNRTAPAYGQMAVKEWVKIQGTKMEGWQGRRRV